MRCDARRRAHRQLGRAAREEPVRGHGAGSGDRGGSEPRLFLRPEAGCFFVVPVDRRDLGRCGQPGEVRLRVRGGCCFRRALRHGAETVVTRSVRDRDPDASVPHDAQRDDRVLGQRRLMLDRTCETCQSRLLRLNEGLRLVAFHRSERARCDLRAFRREHRPARCGSARARRRARRARPGRAAPCRNSSVRAGATPPVRRPRRASPRTAA